MRSEFEIPGMMLPEMMFPDLMRITASAQPIVIYMMHCKYQPYSVYGCIMSLDLELCFNNIGARKWKSWIFKPKN